MLRLLGVVLRGNGHKLVGSNNILRVQSYFSTHIPCMSIFAKHFEWPNTLQNNIKFKIGTNLLSESLNKLLIPKVEYPVSQYRSVTKFSLKKGKRKSVKTVLKRFYRLNWGIWIRTRAGRGRHLWKKNIKRRIRLKQHVFCNSTQSWMLDKMVTKFWKRPKYYVDDPYEPYHTREEFIITQTKPGPLSE